MAKNLVCPKCHEKGTMHLKSVKNAKGRVYLYNYFAHYAGTQGMTRKIRWCYIGKGETPKSEEMRLLAQKFAPLAKKRIRPS